MLTTVATPSVALSAPAEMAIRKMERTAPVNFWRVLSTFYNDSMITFFGDFIDIDECAQMIHDCHSNATCTNTPGDFDCDCVPGFTGDGKNCSGTT